MQWLEITINTTESAIDKLCEDLEALGVSGLIIENESEFNRFFENNKEYWDYIDEDLEKSIKGLCRVKFYLEDNEDGKKELQRISSALSSSELQTHTVRDEDWENNWKQYYKPVEVGNRLLIVPQWEKAPASDRTIIRLDPGLIFGTGTHPTTQMCLCGAESVITGGEAVLDLGCGSGILAIAALLLGADHAVGCDIDEKAPNVVMENAALNGISDTQLKVYAGNVLSDTRMKNKIGNEKYDLVLANIVADVIIPLAPLALSYLKPNGTFICSGIIEGRQLEVRNVLEAVGFQIKEALSSGDWHAFRCRLN